MTIPIVGDLRGTNTISGAAATVSRDVSWFASRRCGWTINQSIITNTATYRM